MVATTPPPVTHANGATPTPLAEQTSEQDFLISYLPGVLRQDPFLQRFLRIFDELIRPILQTIDGIDCYLDPRLAPAELVGLLAAWLGEVLRDRWPEGTKRRLVAEAAKVHRARGTRKALRETLELVTGAETLVIENTPGLRLDPDARMGVNTSLERATPHTLGVTFLGTRAVDTEAVEEVIRRLKPAHVSHSVKLVEG